jgi:hypothetical protein
LALLVYEHRSLGRLLETWDRWLLKRYAILAFTDRKDLAN